MQGQGTQSRSRSEKSNARPLPQLVLESVDRVRITTLKVRLSIIRTPNVRLYVRKKLGQRGLKATVPHWVEKGYVEARTTLSTPPDKFPRRRNAGGGVLTQRASQSSSRHRTYCITPPHLHSVSNPRSLLPSTPHIPPQKSHYQPNSNPKNLPVQSVAYISLCLISCMLASQVESSRIVSGLVA